MASTAISPPPLLTTFSKRALRSINRFEASWSEAIDHGWISPDRLGSLYSVSGQNHWRRQAHDNKVTAEQANSLQRQADIMVHAEERCCMEGSARLRAAMCCIDRPNKTALDGLEMLNLVRCMWKRLHMAEHMPFCNPSNQICNQSLRDWSLDWITRLQTAASELQLRRLTAIVRSTLGAEKRWREAGKQDLAAESEVERVLRSAPAWQEENQEVEAALGEASTQERRKQEQTRLESAISSDSTRRSARIATAGPSIRRTEGLVPSLVSFVHTAAPVGPSNTRELVRGRIDY